MLLVYSYGNWLCGGSAGVFVARPMARMRPAVSRSFVGSTRTNTTFVCRVYLWVFLGINNRYSAHQVSLLSVLILKPDKRYI